MSAAEPKSICVYFQSGYCRNGSKCRFSHVGYNGERKNPDWHYPHGFYYYDSICKFVEKGQKCPYGWNCWYYHPERDQPTIKDRKPKKKGKKEKNFPTDKATGPIESENNVECPLPVTTTDKAAVEFISRSRENKSAEATVNIFQAKVDSPSRRPLTCINAPQFIFDVVSLSEEDLKKLRTKEVEFLKIKYKGCRVTENTNEIVVEIPFLPSDPDWVTINDIGLSIYKKLHNTRLAF